MQIKSFTARTSKEVLAQIKEELGPDAVILDTREEDGEITMTCALERSAPFFGGAEASGFDPVGGRPSRYQLNPGSIPQTSPFSFFHRDEPDEDRKGADLADTYSARGTIRPRRSGDADDADAPAEPNGARAAAPRKTRVATAGPGQAGAGAARQPGTAAPAPGATAKASPGAAPGAGPESRPAAGRKSAASPDAARNADAGAGKAGVKGAPRAAAKTAAQPELAHVPAAGHAPAAPSTPATSGRSAASPGAGAFPGAGGFPGASAFPGAGMYPGGPPGWQQWHEEWSSIKNHILALMKPALRLDLLPPRQRLAIEFLQREGVEDTAVMHLFQHLQADPSASILGPLSQLVPVRSWGAEGWPQRLQMIAGPFGAGKTSVAIRMALSLRRTAPSCRICLVNADATRGNGRLLLRHYCELSDLAYKEAATTLDLVAMLNEALRENYDRVIVDLPGFSRGRYLGTLISDAGLAECTGEGPDDLAVHLALPPHYGSLQLSGVLERYRVPHAGSIVWTKLDEAEHYGQIINVAASTGLPVSALSFGPGLGNSLAPAKENMLWRLFFKRELPIGA